MNKLYFHLLFYCLLAVLFTSCYDEYILTPEINNRDNWVQVDEARIFFDNENWTALLPIREYGEYEGILKFQNYKEIKINGKSLASGEEYEFGDITIESTFSLALIKENGASENYILEFGLFPVLEINHNYQEIPDDPKIISNFCLFDPFSNTYYEEYCGIETRGGSANSQPKKSFSIEFNKISSLDEEKNISLFGMGADDDWILDATYIDKSNMRNRVSFELWKDIQSEAMEGGRNTLPSSTKGRYVEVFINSEYSGLYCLSEYIDEKRLHIKDLSDQSFLYKAEHWSPATTYSGLPDTLNTTIKWAEWEQKFPNPDVLSIWKPLYDFVEFIVESPDEIFIDSIADYLEIDQAIDFFILINLIQGSDNAGKNVFMTKTSIDEPFFISPWDMDASWGRNWLGEETTMNGVVTFKIYQRLLNQNPENYSQRLANRWSELRSGVLAYENIIESFDQYHQEITLSGAAKRESRRWPESLPEFENEILYLENWIAGRLIVLDTYFNNL